MEINDDNAKDENFLDYTVKLEWKPKKYYKGCSYVEITLQGSSYGEELLRMQKEKTDADRNASRSDKDKTGGVRV